MHQYKFKPLYSHCYTPTCFITQGAIVMEYKYIPLVSTNYMSRCQYTEVRTH
jgi:hypothetical protein